MHRAKHRRRGQQHESAGRDQVDRFSVGVHSQKLSALRNIHLPAELLGQILEARLQPIGEYVGHRHQPGRALRRRPCVASAFAAAPVPRPPQPTRTISIVFRPAA